MPSRPTGVGVEVASRRRFKDPQLDGLVASVPAENLDLRSAAGRVVDGSARAELVVLGLDFAGRIRFAGRGIGGFKVGQDVMSMTGSDRGGSLAETRRRRRRRPACDAMRSWHHGASTLPLASRTAWQALIGRGKLERRQRVLNYGHAGGVGTFTVQTARWPEAKVRVRRRQRTRRYSGASELIRYPVTSYGFGRAAGASTLYSTRSAARCRSAVGPS